MKITVMNAKGGTGKTTLLMLMAAAYALSGRDIFILDLDPQKSASDFLPCLKAKNIHLLENASSKPDIVLCDTPPSLSYPGIEKVLRESDKIIVTTSPSPTDIMATKKTEEFLQKNKQHKKARILLTRVEPGNTLTSSIDETKKLFSLPFLKNTLPKRVSYQRFIAEGFAAVPRKDKDYFIQNILMDILS